MASENSSEDKFKTLQYLLQYFHAEKQVFTEYIW